MPDRAARKIRLERGEGRERVFWEIARADAALTTRFGKHLNSGRTITKKYATADDASSAFDKAIADKRREGYSEPTRRAEVGSTGKKGVSAHDAKLEALIEASPNNAEAYLVYADWLQHHGDSRVELITIQHRLATAQDEREISALERDEAKLFSKFRAELLGSLAEHVIHRDSIRSYRIFSWRYGFIRSARASKRWSRKLLVDLFTQPSGRFLERLVCPGTLDPHHENTCDVLRTLAPRSLRTLYVGEGRGWEPIAIEPLWKTFPRLRSLTLHGEVTVLGTPDENVLEDLCFTQANRDMLAAVATHRWPKLRTFHATLNEPALDALKMLLAPTTTPELERATVRQWFVGLRGPMTQDDVVMNLVHVAAARRLARLDLEMPISASAVHALVSAPSTLRAIGTLGLAPDVLDEAARAAITKVHEHIVWLDTPEEVSFELSAIDVS